MPLPCSPPESGSESGSAVAAVPRTTQATMYTRMLAVTVNPYLGSGEGGDTGSRGFVFRGLMMLGLNGEKVWEDAVTPMSVVKTQAINQHNSCFRKLNGV